MAKNLISLHESDGTYTSDDHTFYTCPAGKIAKLIINNISIYQDNNSGYSTVYFGDEDYQILNIGAAGYFSFDNGPSSASSSVIPPYENLKRIQWDGNTRYTSGNIYLHPGQTFRIASTNGNDYRVDSLGISIIEEDIGVQ